MQLFLKKIHYFFGFNECLVTFANAKPNNQAMWLARNFVWADWRKT